MANKKEETLDEYGSRLKEDWAEESRKIAAFLSTPEFRSILEEVNGAVQEVLKRRLTPDRSETMRGVVLAQLLGQYLSEWFHDEAMKQRYVALLKTVVRMAALEYVFISRAQKEGVDHTSIRSRRLLHLLRTKLRIVPND